MQFDAFISYRHMPTDSSAARLLQRLLEHYKPPKPYHKRKVKRVFIDVSEMPLTGDLRGDIRLALEQSRYLILICSPDWPKSGYCTAELRYFMELHGGKTDHILTVLVRGEPKEAIPPELFLPPEEPENGGFLQELEPLYCDIRAENEKKVLRRLRREYLRIAAPLLGCEFDDLYRRAVVRRRRRQAQVAGAVAVAALAIGGYGYAMQQQVLRNKQAYFTEKSMTRVRQAQGALAQDDTLLAMLYASNAGAEEAGMALPGAAERVFQSAVMQHEFKRQANVFPLIMRRSYAYTEELYSTDQYFISESNSLLLDDSWEFSPTQIVDLGNGALLMEPTFGKPALSHDRRFFAQTQILLASDGKLMQYVEIWDLHSFEQIVWAPLRQISGQEGVLEIENMEGGSFAFRDGAQFVAGFDSLGTPMGEDAVAKAKQERGERLLKSSPATGRRYRVQEAGKKRAIIDGATGEERFVFPSGAVQHAFSGDESVFAYAVLEDRTIYLLDTATWEVQHKISWLEQERMLGCSLGEDGSMAIVRLRRVDAEANTDVNYLHVYAEPFQEPLFTTSGNGIYDVVNNRLIVCDHGMLSVYAYQPQCVEAPDKLLELAAESPVALFQNTGGGLTLVEGETGEVFLETTGYTEYAVNQSLDRLLLWGGATPPGLYSGQGELLLDCSAYGIPDQAAISPDGTTLVLAQGEKLTIIDAQNGQKKWEGSVPVGDILHLSIAGGKVMAGSIAEAALVDLQTYAITPFQRGALSGGSLQKSRVTDNGLAITMNGLAAGSYLAAYRVSDQQMVFYSEHSAYRYTDSPHTGYLVYQPYLYENKPAAELLVFRYANGGFQEQYTLQMQTPVAEFWLDNTGQYLSVWSGKGTQVYDLASGERMLDMHGTQAVFWRGAAIFPLRFANGGPMALVRPMAIAELRAYAEGQLTSPNGIRLLTEKEKNR